MCFGCFSDYFKQEAWKWKDAVPEKVKRWEERSRRREIGELDNGAHNSENQQNKWWKILIQSKFHMKSLRKQKGTVWQNRVEFLWIHMHFECSSHYFKENAWKSKMKYLEQHTPENQQNNGWSAISQSKNSNKYFLWQTRSLINFHQFIGILNVVMIISKKMHKNQSSIWNAKS